MCRHGNSDRRGTAAMADRRPALQGGASARLVRARFLLRCVALLCHPFLAFKLHPFLAFKLISESPAGQPGCSRQAGQPQS